MTKTTKYKFATEKHKGTTPYKDGEETNENIVKEVVAMLITTATFSHGLLLFCFALGCSIVNFLYSIITPNTTANIIIILAMVFNILGIASIVALGCIRFKKSYFKIINKLQKIK